MEKMHSDVVIVGAGPGGSAAAHYLAGQGLDVKLLDKASFPRDKTCGDGLTPRALSVLADMGLLEDLLQTGRQVRGLGMVAPGGRAFEAPFPEIGLPASRTSGTGSNPAGARASYGLIIPRLVLDQALLERAIASGADFHGGVRVSQVSNSPDGVLVSGDQDGRPVTVRASAAVIATGANTGLLRRMGLLPRAPQVALAARAYFERVGELSDLIQLRFEGVPLPGYGWVFPLPGSAANIGAGIFPRGWGNEGPSGTAQAAFRGFRQAPGMSSMLAGACQVSPLKSYPLRIDFTRSPTFADRVLLVGEAAGLANPLTGEGIDYALESGKLAAEHLVASFAAGDFSRSALAGYDRLLRRQFQRLFVFCTWWRDLVVSPRWVDPMVGIGARHSVLKQFIVNIVFGNSGAAIPL